MLHKYSYYNITIVKNCNTIGTFSLTGWALETKWLLLMRNPGSCNQCEHMSPHIFWRSPMCQGRASHGVLWMKNTWSLPNEGDALDNSFEYWVQRTLWEGRGNVVYVRKGRHKLSQTLGLLENNFFQKAVTTQFPRENTHPQHWNTAAGW